jgi:glycosyltransferase involved in cell wall biosynthesis
MEELKFSILVCVYGNPKQFKNFLWTACNQDFEGYEIVIVDNATEDDSIFNVYQDSINKLSKIRYFAIGPKQKQCTNITQGINIAAQKAVGRFIVIVADPNILLSFNLLSQISKLIDDKFIILSSGMNDVKISPKGTPPSEWHQGKPEEMAQENEKILIEMGWPDDPLNLKLIKGKYRWPPPHRDYDCYVAALSRKYFLNIGGYPMDQTTYGTYHAVFLSNLATKLKPKKLTDVRIIHQYHRSWYKQTLEDINKISD